MYLYSLKAGKLNREKKIEEKKVYQPHTKMGHNNAIKAFDSDIRKI